MPRCSASVARARRYARSASPVRPPRNRASISSSHSRSRNGSRITSASSSLTAGPKSPRATCAASRSSVAYRRVSCRAATSACAHAPSGQPASTSPRHSCTAHRSAPVARSSAPARSAARPACTSSVNRCVSSRRVSPRSAYPAGLVTIDSPRPAVDSDRRRYATWACNVFVAAAGGRSSQIPSTNCDRETTSGERSASNPNRVRCRGPPSATGLASASAPTSRTSSGPSRRTSMVHIAAGSVAIASPHDEESTPAARGRRLRRDDDWMYQTCISQLT